MKIFLGAELQDGNSFNSASFVYEVRTSGIVKKHGTFEPNARGFILERGLYFSPEHVRKKDFKEFKLSADSNTIYIFIKFDVTFNKKLTTEAFHICMPKTQNMIKSLRRLYSGQKIQ